MRKLGAGVWVGGARQVTGVGEEVLGHLVAGYGNSRDQKVLKGWKSENVTETDVELIQLMQKSLQILVFNFWHLADASADLPKLLMKRKLVCLKTVLLQNKVII